MLDQIAAAERLCTRVLTASQQPDGGFLSVSDKTHDFVAPTFYHTTFFPSLILYSLSIAHRPELGGIKRNLIAFLLSQRSPHWSFNYWQKGTPEHENSPFPDDLDDTFCALSALFAADPSLITGEVLAKAVQLLTATEQQPGGPYRTWLVEANAGDEWQDIDLAVNSNVALFLAQQRVTVPGVTKFIESRIIQNNYSSPYYPTFYPIIYFISRTYRGAYCDNLRQFLLTQQFTNASWGNVQDTALAISALLRCGLATANLAAAITKLCQLVEQEGLQPHPFCTNFIKEGQSYYSGSAALTAALCLEALALFKVAQSADDSAKVSDNSAEQHYQTIITAYKNRISQLRPQLYHDAGRVLLMVTTADQDKQVTLLPYRFRAALGDKGLVVSEEVTARLGLANLYGWIAYSVYDDIFDDGRNSELLPAANFCLRELTSIYQALLPSFGETARLFVDVMDDLESANAWEAHNTRFPSTHPLNLEHLPDYANYQVLADRSFGHALGPLVILMATGFTAKSTEFQVIKTFFRHYLIARQLNDDAHDWQQDLSAGRINSVAARLLDRWGQKEQVKEVDLGDSAVITAMQTLFWEETVHETIKLVEEHLIAARTALNNCQAVEILDMFEELLRPLELAVTKARYETKRAQEFLGAYSQG